MVEIVAAVPALPAAAKARLRCGAAQVDWQPGGPAVLARCAKGDSLEVEGPYWVERIELGAGDTPVEGTVRLRVLPVDVPGPAEPRRAPAPLGVHAYLGDGGAVILRREREGALLAEARADLDDRAELARRVRELSAGSAPLEVVLHGRNGAAFDDIVKLAGALVEARAGLTPEPPLRVVPEPLPLREDAEARVAEGGALALDLARPDALVRLRRALETCGLVDAAPPPEPALFSFAAELTRRAAPERLGLCSRETLTTLLLRLAAAHASREQSSEAVARVRQARVVDPALALPADAPPALRAAWLSKVGLGYGGASDGGAPRVNPAIALRVVDVSGPLTPVELEAALRPAAPFLAACCAAEAPYARCDVTAQLVVGVDGRAAAPSVDGQRSRCVAHVLRSLPPASASGALSTETRARATWTIEPGL